MNPIRAQVEARHIFIIEIGGKGSVYFPFEMSKTVGLLSFNWLCKRLTSNIYVCKVMTGIVFHFEFRILVVQSTAFNYWNNRSLFNEGFYFLLFSYPVHGTRLFSQARLVRYKTNQQS